MLSREEVLETISKHTGVPVDELTDDRLVFDLPNAGNPFNPGEATVLDYLVVASDTRFGVAIVPGTFTIAQAIDAFASPI